MLRRRETARQGEDSVITKMYAETVRNSDASWRQCHKVYKCMLRW